MPAFEPFEQFDDITDVVEQLNDPDPNTRRVAVINLADSADPLVVGYLRDALADDATEVRLQIALALGEFDGADTASALAIAVTDADNGVAQAAADSMAELKDPSAADPIFPIVTHENAFVREAALRALKELRRPDCLKPALEAFAMVQEQD